MTATLLVHAARPARLEDEQLLGPEVEHPEGGRLQVVEELDTRHLEPVGQCPFLEHPGEVGRLAPAIDDHPGDPEAGPAEPAQGVAAREFGQDQVECRVGLAREDLLADQSEHVAGLFEECQDRLRAADIASQ